MKLAGSAAESFVKRPDPAVRAVLLHGPDEGQVRERMQALTRTVCPDVGDPFRVADIAPATLSDDPARLADELAAIAFGGGRRVVRVAQASDSQAAAILGCLARPVGDALLIVSAGVLPPKSKLRSAFESTDGAVAIACYPAEGRALVALIRQGFADAGIRLEADAAETLAALLADDTASAHAEIEKLRLYLGDEPRALTPDDVRACCGDQSAHSVFELAAAVADGRQGEVQAISDRLFQGGDNAVAIVRGVSRHFDRLFQARAAIEAGASADAAMKALRPAVFFKETDSFRRQLGTWTCPTLLAAIDRLTEVERQCKSTGIPAPLVTQRGLMEIAALARRARGGR
ncbi:DNA polymerase III [uncultured Alphaproteobacteria bacterium]|uniref:DNA-directed DNA polymerase n=1 Tax=uncultured Alphaproteobacteria bacterium TaxID=91750 RepID=A0A212KBF7_9PROT|nr:DNA polymerase III [uncultured Alphaproteobacteria bacterium]